jgi:hypothetical protein
VRRHTGFGLIPCEHIGGDAAIASLLGAASPAELLPRGPSPDGIEYEWSRYALPTLATAAGSGAATGPPCSVLVRTRVGGR